MVLGESCGVAAVVVIIGGVKHLTTLFLANSERFSLTDDDDDY